jgi:hypothetical protein
MSGAYVTFSNFSTPPPHTKKKSKIFDSDTSHGFMPKCAEAEFLGEIKVVGAFSIVEGK